jgi:hypothetical protein
MIVLWLVFLESHQNYQEGILISITTGFFITKDLAGRNKQNFLYKKEHDSAMASLLRNPPKLSGGHPLYVS